MKYAKKAMFISGFAAKTLFMFLKSTFELLRRNRKKIVKVIIS